MLIMMSISVGIVVYNIEEHECEEGRLVVVNT